MNEIKQRIIKQAEAAGVQVTSLREQVLDLVLQHPDGVIKAYHVLSQMQMQSGSQVAPPTAYRALDFWAEQGVLHKVAAVNGYVLCSHAQHDCGNSRCNHHADERHTAFILVCTECGAADEQALNKEWAALQRGVAENGFVLTEKHVVLTGICKKCQ